MRYLNGKKEFFKKWLDFGQVINIFYGPKFLTNFVITDQPFLGVFWGFFWLRFFAYFLVSFLSALKIKCLENKKMPRLLIFRLNSELKMFYKKGDL